MMFALPGLSIRRSRRARMAAAALLALLAVAITPTEAQDQTGGGTPLSIKREPIAVRPVDRYQIPLSLSAAREVTLRAPVTGAVQTVLVALGEDVAEQGEVVRFESDIAQLRYELAKLRDTRDKTNGLQEKIAKAELDRLTVKAPFAGRVVAVDVVGGSNVEAGSPLATVADVSKLTARLPFERDSVAIGDTVQVRVESTVVDGRVTAVLPAGERLGPLRPLFASLVEAVVEIDGERATPGQTVYSDLIPRDAVAEVPNTAVQTAEDGSRIVFVLRDDYAYAVPVQPLGRVGDDRTFVAGKFVAGDEVVTGSSEPLVDGALIVTQAEATAGQGGGNPQGTQRGTGNQGGSGRGNAAF